MTVRLPGAVVLAASEAAWFVHVERDIIAGWNRDGIVPDGLRAALVVMREAAADEGLARPPGRAVPMLGDPGSEARVLRVTVREAAARLQISERAIVKAIHSGRLSGRRVGGGKRWEITSESVDLFPCRVTNRLEAS